MQPFSMTLNVSFDRPDQMADFLAGIAKAFESAKSAIAAFVADPVKPATEAAHVTSPVTAPVELEPVKVPGKRGPKPKNVPDVVEKPAPAPEIVETVSAEPELPELPEIEPPAAVEAPKGPVAVPTSITTDTLRKHAQAFVGAKGAPAFEKVMKGFGVYRISDLQPADFRRAWEAFAI